eukprot:CAMPEP_0171137880 /NCGR_PEP_ID=MMETSP0766_2-20121228/134116_1 /TAXON_ID=439317 /ORGANISM="Gambierdiscus australes, Strain CAWD 149" /LENGTH=366 /DNA_ID=CAMNT_0011601473 /DNA_START=99 /DNA_END=1197 /DNA_ORIENTATION=+
MMLRDPTKRAISSWGFHRQLTLELRTFEEAVSQGMRQRSALESCYKTVLLESGTSAQFISELPEGQMEAATNRCFWDRIDTHDATIPMELPLTLMHAHVDKGVYVDQIRRWFALLGRENFFVFSLEEWIKDPEAVFKEMLTFAGLDLVGPLGFASASELRSVLSTRYNEDHGKLFRSPPKHEVVEALEAFYKPYNEELFAVLGGSSGETALFSRLWIRGEAPHRGPQCSGFALFLSSKSGAPSAQELPERVLPQAGHAASRRRVRSVANLAQPPRDVCRIMHAPTVFLCRLLGVNLRLEHPLPNSACAVCAAKEQVLVGQGCAKEAVPQSRTEAENGQTFGGGLRVQGAGRQHTAHSAHEVRQHLH